jgi:hypothetical protein
MQSRTAAALDRGRTLRLALGEAEVRGLRQSLARARCETSSAPPRLGAKVGIEEDRPRVAKPVDAARSAWRLPAATTVALRN